MRKIRTYQDVTHDTGSGLLEQVVDQQQRLAKRLAPIRSVVAVASGKGGVGKSAITANLAAALAARGLTVGAADADLNGPSLGRMLGVSGARLTDRPSGVAPAESPSGVRVISMELLQEEEDAPLRWREPEMGGFIWQSTLETGVLLLHTFQLLDDSIWRSSEERSSLNGRLNGGETGGGRTPWVTDYGDLFFGHAPGQS